MEDDEAGRAAYEAELVTSGLQACRPEDRAMLSTPAGTELVAKCAAALAWEPAYSPLPNHDNHHNALRCPYCNPQRLVLVTQEDANNYCRVLTALGMGGEGDPVDGIETLQRQVRQADERGDDAMRRAHKAEAAIAAAVPAMREFARKNPKHHFGETLQDPSGVHAWLAEFGA